MARCVVGRHKSGSSCLGCNLVLTAGGSMDLVIEPGLKCCEPAGGFESCDWVSARVIV